MKLDKKQRHIIGISLVFSAISLMLSFIVLCFKKKSLLSAVLALAAAEGIVGLSMIKDMELPKKEDDEEEEPSELFEDEDLADAEAIIDAELSQRNDGEAPVPPNAKREIPKYDEASEADFM